MKTLRIPQWLEQNLNQYERIILFIDWGLLREFCNSEIVRHTEKNLLLLVSEKVEIDNPNIHILCLEKAESKQLCLLYSIYEFAGHFCVISDHNKLFGDLESFVTAGLMEQSEYFQIILGE